MSNELQAALSKYVQNAVTTEISKSLSKFDLSSTVSTQVKDAVKEALVTFEFPNKAIPTQAIDWTNFKINVSMLSGKHENFSSSGIEDNATTTELKIEDNGVIVDSIDAQHARLAKLEADVIETDELTVNGPVEFSDVTVRGTLKADNIKGLDELVAIKETINIDGKAVLSQKKLGNSVLESNLRSVGTLKELVVSGESLFADTLYTSPAKRVGINTIEPTHVLSIWEQEVEVNIGKLKQDSAIIGTTRQHNVHLQSGSNDNIILHPTGKTQIDNPVLNNRTFTNNATVPGYSGSRGDICWNDNPELGKPIGWVCLGGTRWATFGKIE
tara:strand:- start:1597 stop:2580 length:984 start_codon:yes stop_codon:yes gene_type:complete